MKATSARVGPTLCASPSCVPGAGSSAHNAPMPATEGDPGSRTTSTLDRALKSSPQRCKVAASVGSHDDKRENVAICGQHSDARAVSRENNGKGAQACVSTCVARHSQHAITCSRNSMLCDRKQPRTAGDGMAARGWLCRCVYPLILPKEAPKPCRNRPIWEFRPLRCRSLRPRWSVARFASLRIVEAIGLSSLNRRSL